MRKNSYLLKKQNAKKEKITGLGRRDSTANVRV